MTFFSLQYIVKTTQPFVETQEERRIEWCCYTLLEELIESNLYQDEIYKNINSSSNLFVIREKIMMIPIYPIKLLVWWIRHRLKSWNEKREIKHPVIVIELLGYLNTTTREDIQDIQYEIL